MDQHEDPIGSTNRGYAFGDSEAAAARLALLSEVFETCSRSFLTSVTPRTIEVAIDLGCGPGFSTGLLASLTPKVLVGIDASPEFIERARTGGPATATWRRHDVTSVPLPSGPADLLYARLLLAHLAHPLEVVSAWLGELRPGGRLLIEEDEFIDLDDPTLGAYEELATSLVAHRGGNLYVGRQLKDLQVSADFERIVDRVHHHSVPVPLAAQLFSMNFAVWRNDPWIVAQRSTAWLDAMDLDLGRLADSDDQGSVVFGVRQVALQRTAPK